MLEDYSTILCEGDFNSLDYRIYSKVFDKQEVIPCGANSILKMKELKLKNKESVCSITDRDLLTEDDISELMKIDIYTLKVRAIENVLVTDYAMHEICKKLDVGDSDKTISSIKKTLFNKYGKKLNKLFEFEISEDNILEFYNPKKVVDTVSIMLGLSKNEYINSFYDLLDNKDDFKSDLKNTFE